MSDQHQHTSYRDSRDRGRDYRFAVLREEPLFRVTHITRDARQLLWLIPLLALVAMQLFPAPPGTPLDRFRDVDRTNASEGAKSGISRYRTGDKKFATDVLVKLTDQRRPTLTFSVSATSNYPFLDDQNPSVFLLRSDGRGSRALKNVNCELAETPKTVEYTCTARYVRAETGTQYRLGIAVSDGDSPAKRFYTDDFYIAE